MQNRLRLTVYEGIHAPLDWRPWTLEELQRIAGGTADYNGKPCLVEIEVAAKWFPVMTVHPKNS